MQALVMKILLNVDDSIKALPYKTLRNNTEENILRGTTGLNTTKPTGFIFYFASYKV